MKLTREQWIDAAENPDFEEFNEDLMDDDYFDCGMTRDGNCTKAGSEECDWECPYSDLLYGSVPNCAQNGAGEGNRTPDQQLGKG